MQRAVLTVFKSNAGALRFYQRAPRCYAPDDTDPGVCAGGVDPECGYRILSKPLGPGAAAADAQADRSRRAAGAAGRKADMGCRKRTRYKLEGASSMSASEEHSSATQKARR